MKKRRAKISGKDIRKLDEILKVMDTKGYAIPALPIDDFLRCTKDGCGLGCGMKVVLALQANYSEIKDYHGMLDDSGDMSYLADINAQLYSHLTGHFVRDMSLMLGYSRFEIRKGDIVSFTQKLPTWIDLDLENGIKVIGFDEKFRSFGFQLRWQARYGSRFQMPDTDESENPSLSVRLHQSTGKIMEIFNGYMGMRARSGMRVVLADEYEIRDENGELLYKLCPEHQLMATDLGLGRKPLDCPYVRECVRSPDGSIKGFRTIEDRFAMGIQPGEQLPLPGLSEM